MLLCSGRGWIVSVLVGRTGSHRAQLRMQAPVGTSYVPPDLRSEHPLLPVPDGVRSLPNVRSGVPTVVLFSSNVVLCGFIAVRLFPFLASVHPVSSFPQSGRI